MTQAIARDLLADAIVRCERAKLRVIMHVHDEIVLESSHLEADLETLVQIMSTGPAWADGLPLKSVGEITKRYKK
jgi:DNA polymerase